MALLNYKKQQQVVENDRHSRFIQTLIPALDTVLNGKSGQPPPFQQNYDDEEYYNIGGF